MHFVSSANFTINAFKYSLRSLINLCSSRGRHFLKHGAQSPKAAVSRVFSALVPLRVSGALSLEGAKPGRGSWCWRGHVCPCQQPACASSQQGPEQRALRQQLGTARAGLGWGVPPPVPETPREKTRAWKQNGTLRATWGVTISCL